jgi:lipoprotein-releasing system ATP-binding protein
MVAVDLHKSYRKGKVEVPVLQGINLGVREREFLAVVGQSGSGKSTLLHLLGTLDVPDHGSIHFDGRRVDNLPGAQRDMFRNRFVGMIFQFYHLIPEMSMIENVLSPIMVRESFFGYMRHRTKYRKTAAALLDRLGLGHRMNHKPNELSGGEMQRAAIARALISKPQILLADEPTGNLDSKSAQEIISLLHTLNKEENLTIVMVTHDLSIAQDTDRLIRLVDGKVVL